MQFGDSFVLAKNPNTKMCCLNAYTLQEWENFIDSLNERISANKTNYILRFMVAEEISINKQGRFFVPLQLRTYAKIKEQAVIISSGEHFEIWNKNDLEETLSLPCDVLDLLEQNA